MVDPGPEERSHLLRGFLDAGHQVVALTAKAEMLIHFNFLTSCQLVAHRKR